MEKKICWITSSCFLDVDLPVIAQLNNKLNIDWYIINNSAQATSDEVLIRTQTDAKFTTLISDGRFFMPSTYSFYKKFIKDIKDKDYYWYYIDVAAYLYFFPLLRKNIPIEKITIATHNVKTPKGARFSWLAGKNMKYITSHFINFQVFSKNQKNLLKSIKPNAGIFYAPLMLKHYGEGSNKSTDNRSNVVNFLFFGNILRYKRLDVLLHAVRILKNKGLTNFTVNICGYCRPEVWKEKYEPLVQGLDNVNLDIRRIPNELVAEYFNKASFFVMPYQDIAQSGAMTVALNYNVPIIASRLDTFKEFLTDGLDGFFAEEADPADFAAVMERSLNMTQDEYAAMKVAQKNFVAENLSSEKIAEKYYDYFIYKLNNADTCNR